MVITMAKGKKSKKDIVFAWRDAHPQGRRCELYNDKSVNISKSTVDKWWSYSPVKEKPLSVSERVRAWKREHPGGTHRACAEELGVTERIVYMRWNDYREEQHENAVPVKTGKYGQLEFLFDEFIEDKT